MTITNPMERLRARGRSSTSGPHIVLVGALATVLVGATVLDQSLTKEQLLPAVCIIIFVAAAAISAGAWCRTRFGRTPLERQMSYWDAAGGLIFLGICMAALVEPDRLVDLVAKLNSEH